MDLLSSNQIKTNKNILKKTKPKTNINTLIIFAFARHFVCKTRINGVKLSGPKDLPVSTALPKRIRKVGVLCIPVLLFFRLFSFHLFLFLVCFVSLCSFFLYFHFNGLSPFYVCILDIVNEVSLSLCLNLCFLLLLSLLSLCFTLHFSLSLSSFSPNFCLDFCVDFFFCFTFFCVETFVCVFSSKSQHLYTFFLLLKTNSKLLCFWTESLSNCCNRSGIYYFITRNSKKPIVLKCKIPSCFESPLETLSLSLPSD